MHFVYSLKSGDDIYWYVGITNDINRRLEERNDGKCTHTNKHKPWKLIIYTAFTERKRAQEFDRYLKSHSGRAFTKKHL